MISDPSRRKAEARLRLRRLLRLVVLASVLAVAGSLAWLAAEGVELRWPLVLSITVGVGATVLITGALMALLFFSSSSGADDEVDDRG